MQKRIIEIVVAVVALVLMGAEPIGATEQKVADQCVVHVIGRRPSGEMTVSSPRCYATFTGAMAAEGVDAWGTGAAARVDGIAAATFVLATHYDGSSYNGSSTSTVGSDCGGGWLNTEPAWNNRISSTLNGCPRVRHYTGAGLTGSSQTTVGSGGVMNATLNNATSSIQYLT